jgi:hypothetical protein
MCGDAEPPGEEDRQGEHGNPGPTNARPNWGRNTAGSERGRLPEPSQNGAKGIVALIRVVRRMDRKTPEKKTGAFLTGAEAEGGGMRLTGE